jgi:hypothetical protein
LSDPVGPMAPLQGPDAFPDVTFSKFKLSGILTSSLVEGGPCEDEDAEDVEDPRPLLPPGE